MEGATGDREKEEKERKLMKDKIFGVLQRVGRSFMLPIAILPVAGLLLGLGSSFTNETTIAMYNLGAILGDGTLLHSLLVIMNKVGSAVFDNLPIIFAVGVAIGMAKKEKEVAALSAMIAFFVMNVSINAMLVLNGEILADGSISPDVLEGTITSVCGVNTLQIGVFGGIIVGLGVAALHNKFYKISLPNALSFFSGSRFVPIISTVVYMFVGIVLYFVWPAVQGGIYALGGLVTGTGYIGTLIFGLVKRALIPFGLHHVFYMPFWQTAVGGTMEVAGQLVQGGQNIFFAQLADSANVAHFSADATRYFSGEFIFMIFGLPGAALAMYRTAKPEKKKAAGGLLLSAALACMLTGITEPIEFSFLFVAPILFVVQVVLAGSAYMIAHILNVAVGLTFSGGFLDFFLFGILQGNEKTSWMKVIPVGIIYFLLYYFIFTFLIKKLDLKTPGREDDGDDTKLYTRSDFKDKTGIGPDGKAEVHTENQISAMILHGLGGIMNVEDVDCCATRLRVTVNDPAMVKDDVLKRSGASAVIRKGKGIQVVYGPQVAVIKSDLVDFMESPQASQAYVVDDQPKETVKKKTTPQKKETKEMHLGAHMNGTVVPLAEVKDEVFASGAMGEGAAIEPTEGKLFAPADGVVENVFETKHAVGMTTDDQVELLLHIGIDTVKLGGKHFESHVKAGQKVKKGDLLVSFDMAAIKKEGYLLTTPVIVCNTDDYQAIELTADGKVKAGAEYLKIQG